MRVIDGFVEYFLQISWIVFVTVFVIPSNPYELDIIETLLRYICNYNMSSISFLYTLVIFFALYLSFKKNHGFNLGPFLVALFFAPFYIVHYFALGGTI